MSLLLRSKCVCYPDAIFLYSFLRETKPARIIEVGSGFSSAVMLDTIDRFFPKAPEVTFVEPNALRLTVKGSDMPTTDVDACCW